MFPLPLLLTPFSVFLSLSTATGVFVHDTKIDRATMTALISPAGNSMAQASSKQIAVSSDLHTHAERHSFSQASSELKGGNPKIQPRSPSEKKYLSQKNLGLSHGPFDSYQLPLS